MRTATVLVTVAVELEIDTDRAVQSLDDSVLEDVRSQIARVLIDAADSEQFEEFGLGHYFANISVTSAQGVYISA